MIRLVPTPLMIAGVLAFLLLLYATTIGHTRPAFAPTPLPYSCDQVQWAFKTFTPAHLKKLADAMDIHLTGSQLREAQKCLRK